MRKEPGPGPAAKQDRNGLRPPENQDAPLAEAIWDADGGYEMADMDPDGRRASDVEEEQTRPGAEVEEEDDQGALLAGPHGIRRRSSSSVQSYKLYTPDEEARVRRKLDTRLVLFVALLYMMAFLDRSNIGQMYSLSIFWDF